jgi:hypothetical protein
LNRVQVENLPVANLKFRFWNGFKPSSAKFERSLT